MGPRDISSFLRRVVGGELGIGGDLVKEILLEGGRSGREGCQVLDGENTPRIESSRAVQLKS